MASNFFSNSPFFSFTAHIGIAAIIRANSLPGILEAVVIISSDIGRIPSIRGPKISPIVPPITQAGRKSF